MPFQYFKGAMADLPVKRQKSICKCPTLCTNFINIIGMTDFILCEGVAREYAYDILRTLGLHSDIYQKPKPFWTTKDEQYILDYFAEHGHHTGAYQIIGKHLGRSRDAVKNKVLKMRKEGKPI